MKIKLGDKRIDDYTIQTGSVWMRLDDSDLHNGRLYIMAHVGNMYALVSLVSGRTWAGLYTRPELTFDGNEFVEVHGTGTVVI